MNEKLEKFVSPEGEKAPFRAMVEKQTEDLKELKSREAKWAGLAAHRLSETALED